MTAKDIEDRRKLLEEEFNQKMKEFKEEIETLEEWNRKTEKEMREI